MKTYVLLLSKQYTKDERGNMSQPILTRFKEGILNGKKIHTLRPNFEFWKHRIEQVRQGKAVLSIREWDGNPYRSKQTEIARLTTKDGVGIQELTWKGDGHPFLVDGKKVNMLMLANNELSTLERIHSRMVELDHPKSYAVIHFTNFRY